MHSMYVIDMSGKPAQRKFTLNLILLDFASFCKEWIRQNSTVDDIPLLRAARRTKRSDQTLAPVASFWWEPSQRVGFTPPDTRIWFTFSNQAPPKKEHHTCEGIGPEWKDRKTPQVNFFQWAETKSSSGTKDRQRRWWMIDEFKGCMWRVVCSAKLCER